MNTLICVFCCLMMATTPCGDIDSYLASTYDNVTYVKTIEQNGEYIVAMKTTPFFARSEKNAFVRRVKSSLNEQFGISENNVDVVFDIEILHLIRHADNEEKIAKIFERAS